MKLYRKKDGFTLIELLVVILTGTIVTAAATTVLLLAMRINRKALDTVERQSIMRIMQSVLENMGSDGNYEFTDNEIKDGAGNIVISHDGDEIVAGPNGDGVLMEDVSAFLLNEASTPFNDVQGLYTFSITAGGETYNSSIYSRTQDEAWFADDPLLYHEAGRNQMVEIATSQISSTGQIQRYKNIPYGRHYNLWYVDPTGSTGYTGGWSDATPWCSVFASWVIEQTYIYGGTKLDANNVLIPYLKNAPKEANVNHMWMQFFINAKNMSNLKSYSASLTDPPEPGDLIFFVDRTEVTSNDLYKLRNLNQVVETEDDFENLKRKILYENEGWYVHTSDDDAPLIPYTEWDENNPVPGYERWTVVKQYLGCEEDGLDHIGIVVEVTDSHVYTVEGNVITNNSNGTSKHSVMLRKYPLDNEDSSESYLIFGYATLNWNDAYK